MLDADDVVLPGGPATLAPEDIVEGASSAPDETPPECTVAACRRTAMHDVDGALYCWSCYQQVG